ncbi:MAG: tRNA uridine(34) 5-carboxymethylaminomethyl modification radical SAM/GNAT enzyme Elp3 [Patescibacteria group bacterium]|nr:tRNA uridine(34) 5-carboxymethylaminomethyl modification radical SAM/GNAT enzyme Elp3 [Patescibacteria group bacterium]MDD5490531.1 tRNA uridine(34) 5-carboxymethylaminomethyl modification radical SAM/GNAT enzyme Elp3 [Patescibacteria group bacterium]
MQEQFIKEIIKLKPRTPNRMSKIKRRLAKRFGIPIVPNSEVLKYYHELLAKNKIKPDKQFEDLIKKRSIRTLSGVAPVTLLTKPYPCPGTCAYCPSEPNMPKSYLSNEPAAMRAVLNKFDPYKQVHYRIKALEANGHDTDKIELIVLGGTWSYYPKKYRESFIKSSFAAANDYPKFNKSSAKKSLKELQKKNETAKHRIIGLSLETRADYVTPKEIAHLRELGCTRIQLGVQSIYDSILKLNKRGHGIQEVIKATKLFKDAGFKVDYHLMPNLPGSNPKKDLEMFRQLFSNSVFQPDQLKIYPCIVNKYSLLYQWFKQGKFKPYSDKELSDLLIKIKALIPYYVRLNRLVRDIPKESIEAGNKITNLREYLQKRIKERGLRCKCIRCREARNKTANLKQAKLFIEKYPASGGIEYFLSYENKDRTILYAFVRLRLPSFYYSKPDLKKNSGSDSSPAKRGQNDIFRFIPEIKDCALIRELHTYGQLMPLRSEKNLKTKIQHQGFGKMLMAQAEKIAVKEGFKKIAVIAGVGVRGYYKKLGYKLKGTYMIKHLTKI